MTADAAEMQSPLAFGVEILKIDTLFANPSPHHLGSRFCVGHVFGHAKKFIQ